jgi:hypothetical protein
VLLWYGSQEVRQSLLLAARNYAPIILSEGHGTGSPPFRGSLDDPAVSQDPVAAAKGVASVARGSTANHIMFKQTLLTELVPVPRRIRWPK